jgi:hypothetical protein
MAEEQDGLEAIRGVAEPQTDTVWMSTKQAVESFDLEKGVHNVCCYGITAEELHVKIAVEVSEHINHMQRADLAERFLEMCDTCGIGQALLSLIDAWGRYRAVETTEEIARWFDNKPTTGVNPRYCAKQIRRGDCYVPKSDR